MERIALISDIHGNLPALEATFGDIERRGITRIFCLGDLVGKGPDGAGVVDGCRERCQRFVRGNWDDNLAISTKVDLLIRWQQERLGPERLAWLGGLPNTIDFVLSGQRVRLLHASPAGVYHRVHQDDPEETLLTMFDSNDFTGAGFEPDVVGYGDIHAPYLRTFHRRMLFNVGSVGNPLDLPLVSYAILEGVPGDSPAGPLGISFVRVPYDIERAIRDAAHVSMPDLDTYAKELRTARYRHATP